MAPRFLEMLVERCSQLFVAGGTGDLRKRSHELLFRAVEVTDLLHEHILKRIELHELPPIHTWRWDSVDTHTTENNAGPLGVGRANVMCVGRRWLFLVSVASTVALLALSGCGGSGEKS